MLPFEPVKLDLFSDDPRLTSIEGLELPMRLRYKGSWPPDACGVETGSFRTSAGDRMVSLLPVPSCFRPCNSGTDSSVHCHLQFDLVLQLSFSPDAPCVPPTIMLCKGALELPFVAPFYPRPADAARPPDESRSPISARSRSSSLLSTVRPTAAAMMAASRPAMAARARSESSDKWTLPIDKALPPVPPQHPLRLGQAGPSGSGGGRGIDAVPAEFDVVVKKYDMARAAVGRAVDVPDDFEPPRVSREEDEAPPPAYDGRRAEG